MKTFETSLSKSVRWVGITTVAIVVIGCAILLGRDVPLGAGLYAVVIVVLVLIVTYLMSTRCYEIGEGQLVVRRVLGSKRFELRGASVRRDPQAFAGLSRVVGNGGFFAFDGYFQSRRLGMVRVHARNKDHGIVVVTAGGKKLVLSPDDPEAFLQAAIQAGASLEMN